MATAKTAVAAKKTPGTNVVSLQEQMAAEVANIQSRIGAPSGDNIMVTQAKTFKLPNGEESQGPIELVVVDFISANYFYEGAYDPKNISPPACFSLNPVPTDMVPSANAPVRQADSCAGCAMNQFGSDGNGKACKNTRLLAVLPPDADAETPLAILKVSPTAIKGFDGYVASVSRAFNRPPYGVLTEVGFDPTKTYASLRFGNPKPLDPDFLQMVYNRREEARARLLVEPDVSTFEVAPPKKAAAGRGRR